jgi:hypothetical protein
MRHCQMGVLQSVEACLGSRARNLWRNVPPPQPEDLTAGGYFGDNFRVFWG